MTLHAAIEQVLAQEKRKMTSVEIAAALNNNSWYSKKDGSVIKSSQIGARIKNYPHIFEKEGLNISLKSNTGIQKISAPTNKKIIKKGEHNLEPALAIKVLMYEKNFKSAGTIYGNLPDEPGLYCLRLKDPKALPISLLGILQERKHNIIYIGIASQSLRKRLNQELRAKGHGTFFRSIGAVLGYLPEKGSLVGKLNQNNFKFSKKDEKKIITWIDENLIVNWVMMEGNLAANENQLLKKNMPLLNIAGNPGALQELGVLRERCKKIARENI